jgi:uncharacterized protein
MRRTITVAVSLACLAVGSATALPAVAAPGNPAIKPDPGGIVNLPRGWQYDVLATAGSTPVTSTESGAAFVMPEDPDANVVVQAEGQDWLLTAHELTAVRDGETYLGDAGKPYIPEQATSDDGDVNGWGSVTRIPLSKNGRKAGPAQVITTGLHNLCAGALTPWGTFLVNEEFPFPGDTEPYRSGFVWEVDPVTGAATKLTAMGRFSHEQEARLADGSWLLTEDNNSTGWVFRFVPDSPDDLTSGTLYGLLFDRATGTGTWAEVPAGVPNAGTWMTDNHDTSYAFSKGEGIVTSPDGSTAYFSESGSPTSSNPGRVWRFTDVSATGLSGDLLVEGSFGSLSHPDNLRLTPAGDLLIAEDNGSATSTLANGGMNELRLLPGAQPGDTVPVASFPNGGEPTGPWFSADGTLLYLSVQGDPSRSIVIRGPRSFAVPYAG